MAALDARLEEALRATPPVSGKVAFVCAKGGVAKTVNALVLSSILTHYGRTQVAAVDFNPDQGTLGVRAAPYQDRGRTVRELIDRITYGGETVELDEFITPTVQGAAVFASGSNSIDSLDITSLQYESVMNVLHERFPLVLIDTGNSMTTEVYESILRTVDQIVLAGAFVIDGAVTAANTWSRIQQAGGRLEALANQALVSIMTPKEVSSKVNTDHIRDYFADQTRSGSVREVPWDAHLNEGGVIDIDNLAPATRREFMVLAADIAASMAGEPLFSTSVLPDFL